jgi:hypothetical protein
MPKMKKYWILIIMLFFVISCKKEIPKEEDNTEGSEMVDANLSLSGTVTNLNWDDTKASSFKLQLIKGDVNSDSFTENYTHPNAQVFVTEKNNNSFEFDNLQEGKYTLIATKRGYKISREMIEVKKNAPNIVTVKMEKGSSLGFTGKIQILSEDGKDLSAIKIQRYTTISVFFYLFNGKGSDEQYNITSRHSEGYLAHYFIVNGKSTLVESNWTKEIKPRSGTIKPNEIKLIEVVIDPFVYLLKEHSKCDIEINRDLKIELSY